MITVQHERPSQRLQHRVTVPIKATLAGEGTYETRDWSLNGIALKDYDGNLTVGDECTLDLSIPFQGFDISFPCEARVVRRDSDKCLAAELLSIDDRGRDILSHFIEEIIRGSVTSTDEVLRRIDTPVTPVANTADSTTDDDLPVNRFSWKVVRMLMTHLMVGGVVLGYGGYFLYQNFFMLNISTAVISAPVDPLLSPINGFLSEISAVQGKRVDRSAVLMRLTNPELESEIEFARINVDRKLMELRVRRAEYRTEIQKNADYKKIAESRLEAIESKLERLKAQEILEDMRFEVIEDEYIQGRVSEVGIIDSSLRNIEFDKSLDEARKLLKSRRLLLDSLERGTLIHDNIESNLARARGKMELAEDQMILAKDELTALKNQKNWLHVVAPGDGRVAQWLRAPGVAIKKGEKLALFERDEARVIKAFLTPDQVLRVGLGDLASVYFPSLDRYVEAAVTSIDVTSSTLSAKDIGYIWRRPNEPSARVTMEFLDLTEDQIRESFPSGLPATVLFNQRPTDSSSPVWLVEKARQWWQRTLGEIIAFRRGGGDAPLSAPTTPDAQEPQWHPTPDAIPRDKPRPLEKFDARPQKRVIS